MGHVRHDDARSALAGRDVVECYHPTTRHLPNLVRNTWLAWRVLRRERPAVVVSSGAAVAVPFFVLARLLRVPTVYVEVFDRIDSRTLTGRLCRRSPPASWCSGTSRSSCTPAR